MDCESNLLNREPRPHRAPLPRPSSAFTAELRRFPYPYRAAMAICSDLDETPGAETYCEIIRFLNTTGPTSMGQGVGLEVGNSIYFDMAPNHFAYWNADEYDRARIRTLIQSGHIDVLHSFGDLATTRAHAARALDELQKHDCRLRVWVDHAIAPTNFGSDIMQGHGDDHGHPAYHADLTLAYGIQYVWRGRITSVIGQDQPFRFRNLISDLCPLSAVLRPLSSGHLLAASGTLAKETAKQLLARCGHRKYALHRPNRLMHSIRLRDNAPALEFLRCNPHWGGVSCRDTGVGISTVLTDNFLDTLVGRQGSCILYTHLGKLGPGQRGFNAATIAAFRRLADHYYRRKILVTTTRRLLDFQQMIQRVRVTTERQNGEHLVNINAANQGQFPNQPQIQKEDLAGLTIYVPDPERVRLRFNDNEPLTFTANAPDETGRKSISINYPRLDFPDL